MAEVARTTLKATQSQCVCLVNRALHPVQESSNALGNSYHFSLALHSAFDKQLPLAKSDAKILVLATELSM